MIFVFIKIKIIKHFVILKIVFDMKAIYKIYNNSKKAVEMKQYKTQLYQDEPPFTCCLFHKQLKPCDQNFIDMLRFTFFPFFQLYSFTFFWMVTIIFIYIYSLYLNSADTTQVQNQFLKVSQKALFDLGQNYPYFIVKKYHYYRLLTSTVLCRNFYHFMIGGLGIIIFGSYVQQLVGFKRILLLSITTGVGGQVIRNIFFMEATIDLMTPICGVIGYMFGYYIVNSGTKWRYFTKQKVHMLGVMALMLLLYFQLGYYYRNISIISMTASFCLGYIFYFCDPHQKYFKIRILAVILLIVVVGGSGMWFFIKTDPRLVQI